MTSLRRRGLRVAAISSAALVVSGAAVGACYGPTQMTVEISTDIPCKSPATGLAPRTVLYVGAPSSRPDPTADTNACTPGAGVNDVGSVVIVPADARDAKVSIDVVMNTTGAGTAVCRQSTGDPTRIDPRCIVARRIFRFSEHRARTLRVRLDKRCLGVRCGDEETCQAGACVSAEVTDDGCLDPSCGDAASDGPGDAPSDAPVDAPAVDAADAGERCQGIGGGLVVDGIAPASLIAVNGTHVFWAGETTVGGGMEIYAAPKSGAASAPLAPFFTAAGRPVALFADASRVWVVTDQRVQTLEPANGAPSTVKSVGSVDAFLTATFADGRVWLTRAGAGGGSPVLAQAVINAVDVLDVVPTTTTVQLDSKLAATWNRLYATAPGTQSVQQYGVPPSVVLSEPALAANPAAIAAYDDPAKTVDPAAFLLAETPLGLRLYRVEPLANDGSFTDLGAAPGAAALVVDEAAAYYVDGRAGQGNVYRMPRGTPGGPNVTRTALDRSLYATAAGLALDASCVYFLARPLGGTSLSVRAVPKTGVGGGKVVADGGP